MKKVVIDSNIVFSLLLSHNSLQRTRFFDESILIFAPSYLFFEIFTLKEKLLKYSKLSNADFNFVFNRIFDKIVIVGSEYIPTKTKHVAFAICKEIDEKDTPFIALTIDIDGLLWTGDIRLKNGLKKAGYEFFYN